MYYILYESIVVYDAFVIEALNFFSANQFVTLRILSGINNYKLVNEISEIIIWHHGNLKMQRDELSLLCL